MPQRARKKQNKRKQNKKKNKNKGKKTEQQNNEAQQLNDAQVVEEKKDSVQDLLFKDMSIDDKKNQDGSKKHKWWNKNPVPQMGDKIKQHENCELEQMKKENVRKEPLLLPAQFEWVDLDLADDKTLGELHTFLSNQYVAFEDYRFNYSKETLKWALLVPGYQKFLHIGTIASNTNTHSVYTQINRSSCHQNRSIMCLYHSHSFDDDCPSNRAENGSN